MPNFHLVFLIFCTASVLGGAPEAYSQEAHLQAEKWLNAAKNAEDSSRNTRAIHYYYKSLEAFACALQEKPDAVLLLKQKEAYLGLGKVYQVQSVYDSALEIGQKVLDSAPNSFGHEHPLVAQAYNLLGSTWDEMGQYDKAASFHEKALKIRTNFFGEMHSEVSHSVNNLGNVSLGKGDYEEAIDYFKKSLSIRLQVPDPQPKDIGSSHVNLGIVFTHMSIYDSAFFHFKKAEELFLEVLPKNHHFLSFLYNNIAIAYQETGDFEQAQAYNFRSLKIKEENAQGNLSLLSMSYLNMGAVYLSQGDLFAAEKYLQKGLEGLLKTPHQNPTLIGALYHNLSVVIKTIGDRGLAEEYQLKALEMEKKVYGEIHPEIAKQYNNLALLYQERGDLSKARNFLLKALDIQLKTLPVVHPELGQSYANLGVIEESLENYETAAEYMEKAWTIFRSLFSENHPRIADMYLNRGVIALKQGKEKQARSWIDKSLELRKRYVGERHVSVAQSYFNLAKIFADRGDFDQALPNYERALGIYEENYGKLHPLSALTQLQLGLISQQKGEGKEALDYFDKALQGVGIKSLDLEHFQIESILSEMYALEILYHKAHAHFEWASQEPDQFEACDKSLNYAHKLIEILRKRFQHQETELHLQHVGLPLFELAIRSKLRLYEEKGEAKYLDQAFYFMETSKAYLLQRALSIDNFKDFAALPEEILAKERQLKLTYAYHLHELQNALIQGEDSLRQELLKSSLEIEAAHDSLEALLDEEYPDYYRLKYALPTTNLEDLQKTLKRYPGKVMLEYFWGDESCMVFAISADKIHYRTFPLDSSLIQELEDFIKLNVDMSFIQDEKKFQAGKKQYQKLGYNLYKQFVDSSLQEFADSKSLLIIPDGLLGYLPFEVLLESEGKTDPSFKAFPYLLRKYAFSYEYSSSTFLDAIKAERSDKYSYIGFAPSYEKDTISIFEKLNMGRRSDAHSPVRKLRFNQEEVRRVAKHGGTFSQASAILGEAASEERFKVEAENYDVIHLAMHGFLNDVSALESGLLFSTAADSTEDGILYAHELYNMKLKAQLAVLSACHTAGGELARGEGIFSLSRAFKFAGCPNILASYWQADDKSTQLLIQNFFQRIESTSAAQALQEIKLDYLNQASEVQAHPMNWAAWSLVGDPEVLGSRSPRVPWFFLLCLLLLIAGLSFWLFRVYYF